MDIGKNVAMIRGLQRDRLAMRPCYLDFKMGMKPTMSCCSTFPVNTSFPSTIQGISMVVSLSFANSCGDAAMPSAKRPGPDDTDAEWCRYIPTNLPA